MHKTEEHRCFICEKIGCDHIVYDCPLRCTICRGFHRNENHKELPIGIFGLKK